MPGEEDYHQLPSVNANSSLDRKKCRWEIWTITATAAARRCQSKDSHEHTTHSPPDAYFHRSRKRGVAQLSACPKVRPKQCFFVCWCCFLCCFCWFGWSWWFSWCSWGWSLNLSSRSGVPPLLLSLKSSPGAPKPPPGPPKPTENNTKKTMFRSNP